MSSDMVVLVLSCGGTYDKSKFTRSGKFVCGDPAATGLLQGAGVAATSYNVNSLMRKDSLDMDAADRDTVLATVKDATETRIVIIHGTDTLVDTAKHLVDKVGDKTVVLVGALRPAVFSGSDAAFNLGYALAEARSRAAGVWVAMHGNTWPATGVRKDLELYRFVSDT